MRKTTTIFGRTVGTMAKVAVLALHWGFAHAGESDALHRLGVTDGDAYVTMRDELLGSHADPWDVKKATDYSWQAGLAAYVLNARLARPEEFVRWEKEVESASKMMHLPTPGAGLRRVRVSPAFRLEFAWKPPAWVSEFRWGTEAANQLPQEAARAEAMADASLFGSTESPPLALWRVIWRDSNLGEFRAAAIAALGRSDIAEDQKLALDALFDAAESFEVRRQALYSCAARCPDDSVSKLMQLLSDRSVSSELAATAITVLGNNFPRLTTEYARARAFVEAIASDITQAETVRCAALHACKIDRRTDRSELFRSALMQTTHPALQLTAVRERDELRPALRYAMRNYATPSVVSAATTALLNLGDPADVEFVRAYIDDSSVAEEARSRAASALYAFEEKKRVDAKMEAARQDCLRTGKTWGDWQREEVARRERAWYKDQREKIMSRADPATGQLTHEDAARLDALNADEERFEAQQREESAKDGDKDPTPKAP